VWGLDSSGSEYNLVAGSFEHGNELPGSLEITNFFSTFPVGSKYYKSHCHLALYVKFDVFCVVKINIVGVRVMTPFSLVGRY
jgi:hypothetical protein